MHNNSNLLWSFITSVFLPVIIVQLIIMMLRLAQGRAYQQAGLSLHYLKPDQRAKRKELESKERYRSLRMYSDLRMILSLLRIPLLVLLFFNFQNKLNHGDPGALHTQQGSASFGAGDRMQSQQQNRNRINTQGVYADQQGIFYGQAGSIGWRLALMLMVSGLWLWLLRLHPDAHRIEQWNVSVLWQWLQEAPGGQQALTTLKLWWQWQVPLMLMAQMHFLPSSWQVAYNGLLSLLLVVFVSYSLYQVRLWVRLQDRYIAALDQLAEPLTIMKFRYFKERLALQARPSAQHLFKVALAKHQQSLNIIYGLLVVVSLLGYWW